MASARMDGLEGLEGLDELEGVEGLDKTEGTEGICDGMLLRELVGWVAVT